MEELDAEVIFGIPGGAVLPVYDPLFDSKKLRHVLVRHEQGAGHAASGYAHATGKVGVCCTGVLVCRFIVELLEKVVAY